LARISSFEGSSDGCARDVQTSERPRVDPAIEVLERLVDRLEGNRNPGNDLDPGEKDQQLLLQLDRPEDVVGDIGRALVLCGLIGLGELLVHPLQPLEDLALHLLGEHDHGAPRSYDSTACHSQLTARAQPRRSESES
jgi:hypothetical protein